MPQITVLLPVHNGEAYLEPAIASVLAQSFEDFELLIINDGSTDRTQSIIDTFQDRRIRCIAHQRNRKLIAVLNEGLGLAAAQYVARMDADDVCHPQRLELQYRFLRSHPEVGVLGSAVRLIGGDRKAGLVYRFPEQHEAIVWAMAFLCPLAHPSVMMRRDVVLAAGSYSSWALHAEDYDLWERLSHRTRFANLPEPLLALRRHGASVTVREALQHASTAAAISARCLSSHVARPVSEAVARCLMGSTPCDSDQAEEAARILVERYEGFRARAGNARDIVRRDAGIRLLMLAARRARGLMRLRLAWQATAIAPGAWLRLATRVFRRLTGWGAQSVVG